MISGGVQAVLEPSILPSCLLVDPSASSAVAVRHLKAGAGALRVSDDISVKVGGVLGRVRGRIDECPFSEGSSGAALSKELIHTSTFGAYIILC